MEPNEYFVDDTVRLKEKPSQVMKVTSNVPGGGMGKDYLQTNKFACDWTDEDGQHSVIYKGSELELVQAGKYR